MSLETKYQRLIDAIRQKDPNVKVQVSEEVLYIEGNVATEQEKDEFWDIYNEIDPDYKADDVRLVLEVANAGEEEEYEVKSGDSLSKIGDKYGIAWKKIYEANKNLIKNPDLIQPGWKLKIPAR